MATLGIKLAKSFVWMSGFSLVGYTLLKIAKGREATNEFYIKEMIKRDLKGK